MTGALIAAALAASPLPADTAPVTADAAYVMDRTLVTSIMAPNGETYRLFVSWPEGPPPSTGWPVLYLLDGADHFATATDAARRLARAGGRNGIAPGVIVAIDAGTLARRVRDYTPPTPGYAIPANAPAHGHATGGGDVFLAMIERQVKPLVAARWPIDPARQTLAGHSFGGLLTLHALFVHPAIATRYAAISPSLWFGDNLMAREERAARVHDKRALLAVGSDERGPDAGAGAAAEAMTRRLANAGAKASFLSLSGQTHGTAMLAAMGQIIALAFGTDP